MKKEINFFYITLFSIALINTLSCNYGAGSYPYAETYEVKLEESLLIEKINRFKNNNPHYGSPNETYFPDGRAKEKDFWYYIYFYYPEENTVVMCWTRPSGKNKTTLALVSFKQGGLSGKWKLINRDFDDEENEIEIKKFEERILTPMNIKY